MSGLSLRGTLKSGVERMLLAVGADRAHRGRHRHDILVLAYHNIRPPGEPPYGDRSLHLPQAAFAAQLDDLILTHEVVPLAALEAAPRGDRPRVAITFDDAYRGALTVGWQELERRGLPATVFVAPGILGDRAMWWDELADGEGLDPALRVLALSRGRGLDVEVRALAAGAGLRPVTAPLWARTVTESELAAVVARGLRVGSHSWSHANLAALSGADLEQQLAPPLAWLRERFAAALVPWLAYPYGLTSAAVATATERAGYRRAFLVNGGYATACTAPLATPRFNVPAGLSRRGFVLRTAGWRTDG